MAKGADLLKVLGLVGIGLVAVMTAPKVIKRIKGSKGKLSKVFDDGVRFVDHRIGWGQVASADGIGCMHPLIPDVLWRRNKLITKQHSNREELLPS